MSNQKANVYLVLIVLLALLLRTVWLWQIPNGVFHDEALNGYESYSVLTTLHDRYGRFLPLFYNSFGEDYRDGFYILFTVPFIKLFGLNPFSIRLPAAIIGSATVIVVYFLAKELFSSNKFGLIAALCLAVSPWHIQFSRIAFRAILLPFFVCIAVLFFIKSFKNPKYIALSSLLFGVGLYTYASARVFIPLFVLCLAIRYWKHLYKNKIYTFVGLLLFTGILALLSTVWLSPQGMLRVESVGINNNLSTIIPTYLSYFSPNFLFINGAGNVSHSPAKIGQLYYWEIFTIIIGIITIFKLTAKQRDILILWLVLYPLPAAIVGDPDIVSGPHALRAIVGTPIFAIISAQGLIFLESFLKPQKIWRLFYLFILILSLIFIWKRYFIDYYLYETRIWSFGLREAINYTNNVSTECVFISRDVYDVPVYIQIPFITKYPPIKYQKSDWENIILERDSLDFKDYYLDKYIFGRIPRNRPLKNECLYIVHSNEIDNLLDFGYKINTVETIKTPAGREVIQIIKILKQDTLNER